jgi:cytochrome c oxidase cbb3-type subunit 3
MKGFWSHWVVILTALNIIGALWLLYVTSRRKPGEKGPAEETTGHTWDGDLREYNNPLPRWWLWGFYGSVIFALGYLAFYPGLGNFAGRLGWTQEKAWAAEVARGRAESDARLARFAEVGFNELRRNPEAMRAARNLFANNCATCHGTDAHGSRGFPNLTDADWLYGGDSASIGTTITAGRVAAMPGWEAVLGAEGVDQVANHVLTLSGSPGNAQATAGAAKFAVCAACHGADGRGNVALGAPNLTDRIWLYGGDIDTIKATIAKGRSNRMPAHGELLGPLRVRLLTAYVLNLSGAPEEAPAVATAAPIEGKADEPAAAADTAVR